MSQSPACERLRIGDSLSGVPPYGGYPAERGKLLPVLDFGPPLASEVAGDQNPYPSFTTGGPFDETAEPLTGYPKGGQDP
jgi:hypothetical protein